jgi:hypothetical protein
LMALNDSKNILQTPPRHRTYILSVQAQTLARWHSYPPTTTTKKKHFCLKPYKHTIL